MGRFLTFSDHRSPSLLVPLSSFLPPIRHGEDLPCHSAADCRCRRHPKCDEVILPLANRGVCACVRMHVSVRVHVRVRERVRERVCVCVCMKVRVNEHSNTRMRQCMCVMLKRMFASDGEE